MIRAKRNLLNMGLFNILGLIAIFTICHFLFKEIFLSTETIGGTLFIILAGLVPSLVWLSFFYVLDREEPEPLGIVALAFCAGIIGQIIFSQFLGNIVFDTSSWTLNKNALFLIHTLFIQGALPAVTIYMIVRYVFYPMAEFDEPVDGMMYGAFSGTGYALMMTMSDVFSAGEVSLYFLVVSLLFRLAIFSSLGALIGYFFGIARFNEKQKTRYFVYALVLSLAVFLAYAYLDTRFKMNITTNSDLFSIGLTLVFTVVFMVVTYFLIQNSLKKYDRKELEGLGFFIDKVSAVALVLLLIAGIGLRLNQEKDFTYTSPNGKTSFQLPANFAFQEQKDNIAVFSRNIKGERFPMFLKVITFSDEDKTVLTPMEPISPDFTLNGYQVNQKRSQKIIYLDDEKTSAYTANVFQTIAFKNGQKIIISIESPAQNSKRCFDITKQILIGLKREKQDEN